MSFFSRLFGRRVRPRPLRVHDGDAFAARCAQGGLTPREAEIVRLLLEGKDNRAITAALFISDHTVKNHIHNAYRKLGVRNRVQLVQCFRGALEEPGRPAAGGAAPPDVPAASRRIAAATLAIIVLAVAAALLVIRDRGAKIPSKPVLAILDFENLSADAEMQKWVTGLPMLLAADLMQSKHIRTLSDDAVFGAIRKLGLGGQPRHSRDELRRLAADLRADFLLTGTLMTAGGRIVVTAALQNARTGAPVRTDKIDCRDEQDLMRQADGLCRLVKAGLNLTVEQAESDIDIDAELLTTSSPLAYKYYAEGRRYHRVGDNDQALLMQQKAVELDPEFAMAYWAMALDARNLYRFELEREFMRRAFELADRLPENCRERHLIRGDYYSLAEPTYQLSAEAFRRVLQDHPDDPVANNNLAMLCFDLEDFEAGIAYAHVPIAQDTEYPFPYYTSAVCLDALGRPREAVRLIEAYHGRHPANRVTLDVQIASLIAAGDFSAAAAATERARAVFPEPKWGFWKATTLYATHGAEAARKEFRRLLVPETGSFRILSRIRLGQIELAAGRYREAVDEFSAGLEFDASPHDLDWTAELSRLAAQALMEMGRPDAALVEARRAVENADTAGFGPRLRSALHVQGQASLRAGQAETADALVHRFKAMAETGAGRRPARDYDHYRGMLELERGRPLEAIPYLERAAALAPPGLGEARTAMVYFDLGTARERTGDFAGAARAFEHVVSRPGDRLPAGDHIARSVLGLARAEDRLGRRVRAVEHYRRFLALWKDADPGRGEVAEAEARLQALTGSPGPGN